MGLDENWWIALSALVRALRRAVQRDLGTIASIRANNFFLFVALMVWGAFMSGLEPKSAEPLILLLGVLLLGPLSSDPLSKIPPIRRSLWPLTGRQRIVLRLAGLIVSPVVWIVLFLLVWTGGVAPALLFLAGAAIAQTATMVGIQAHFKPILPSIPGRLGGLIRHTLRQMLSVLDTYLALVVSVGGILYVYFTPHLDPSARPILSILVALAMSTYAQALFGLERSRTRYGLIPLRGWEILLAKDAGYLGLISILVLPLSLGPGLTVALIALAIGHHPSVLSRIEQKPWRFTGGRILPFGLLQITIGIALGFLEKERGAIVLLVAVPIYLASLFWYGSRLLVTRESRLASSP